MAFGFLLSLFLLVLILVFDEYCLTTLCLCKLVLAFQRLLGYSLFRFAFIFLSHCFILIGVVTSQ